MSHCMLAGSQRERRAVCIERCMHGSEGGVGAFSQETARAYPTETPFGGSGRSPKARPRRGDARSRVVMAFASSGLILRSLLGIKHES